MNEIAILDSIAPAAVKRPVWFVDIWGVMHDGVRPFTKAVEVCRTFRRNGTTVILLSNAPRPHDAVIAQLDRIGVDRDAYDAVVTSGDVSRDLILNWAHASLLHIGPERDRAVFDGLTGLKWEDAPACEIAVCTGLYDDETETPADYAALLHTLARRDVPMICANPDLQVVRGSRIIYCAGAIAAAYGALGAKVEYAGKPFIAIYEAAMRKAGVLRGQEVAKADVMAIGDGVATDIAGAAAFGIASVFVASELHSDAGEPLEATAGRLFADASSARPIAVMRELA